jgi:hypothetical protein
MARPVLQLMLCVWVAPVAQSTRQRLRRQLRRLRPRRLLRRRRPLRAQRPTARRVRSPAPSPADTADAQHGNHRRAQAHDWRPDTGRCGDRGRESQVSAASQDVSPPAQAFGCSPTRTDLGGQPANVPRRDIAAVVAGAVGWSCPRAPGWVGAAEATGTSLVLVSPAVIFQKGQGAWRSTGTGWARGAAQLSIHKE